MVLYVLVWKVSAQLEDFGANLSTRAPLFPTLKLTWYCSSCAYVNVLTDICTCTIVESRVDKLIVERATFQKQCVSVVNV